MYSKTNLYFSINGKTCEDVFYKPFYSFGRHWQLCMQSLQLFADLQKQKPCTKFSLGRHHFLMRQWSVVFNIYYKKPQKKPKNMHVLHMTRTYTHTHQSFYWKQQWSGQVVPRLQQILTKVDLYSHFKQVICQRDFRRPKQSHYNNSFTGSSDKIN